MIDREYIHNEHHMTVGDLLKFVEKNNIPMDAPVLMQRVTDWYFTEGSWKTHNKGGYHYNFALKENEKIVSGVYEDKDRYPLIRPEHLVLATEEELESYKEMYYPAFCPVFYKDEPNILFLNAHY